MWTDRERRMARALMVLTDEANVVERAGTFLEVRVDLGEWDEARATLANAIEEEGLPGATLPPVVGDGDLTLPTTI